MLPPDEEWAIVHAVLAGESFRAVATRHGRHVSTIKNVYQYFEENGTVSGRVHLHREGKLGAVVEGLRKEFRWLYLDEYARIVRSAGCLFDFVFSLLIDETLDKALCRFAHIAVDIIENFCSQMTSLAKSCPFGQRQQM